MANNKLAIIGGSGLYDIEELKEMLTAKRLNTDGLKADLVQRLLEE